MRHVVILCGGRSAEHEVSLRSVVSVIKNLDRSLFGISVVGIEKNGGTIPAPELQKKLGLAPDRNLRFPASPSWITHLQEQKPETTVVFPVLHGPYGEDGTVQGLLDLLDLPYVGSGVAGSAVGMNKIHCKNLLKAAGIPVLPGVWTNCQQWADDGEGWLDSIEEDLGFPVFVKPANMGSSVGVGKAGSRLALQKAISQAFRYDDLVLVEKGVVAREIEVSVLGNFEPRASVPGEIIPDEEFYSYRAKYLNSKSQLIIPARLEADQEGRIRDLACEVFRTLQLEGMARVDFLVEKENGSVWVNEPNTIPGFTQISMYPKLWEASGLPYAKLLEELIDLAAERRQRRSLLRVDHQDQ